MIMLTTRARNRCSDVTRPENRGAPQHNALNPLKIVPLVQWLVIERLAIDFRILTIIIANT